MSAPLERTVAHVAVIAVLTSSAVKTWFVETLTTNCENKGTKKVEIALNFKFFLVNFMAIGVEH